MVCVHVVVVAVERNNAQLNLYMLDCDVVDTMVVVVLLEVVVVLWNSLLVAAVEEGMYTALTAVAEEDNTSRALLYVEAVQQSVDEDHTLTREHNAYELHCV